jgi:hypothetical protein
MRFRHVLCTTSLLAVAGCPGNSEVTLDAGWAPPISVPSTQHDTSPPLTELVPAPAPTRPDEDEREPIAPPPNGDTASDPVVQSAIAQVAPPALLANFDGLGNSMPGAAYATPPDPNSAVGDTQVIELVNSSFAVYDKLGHLVYGPTATNTVFGGFGGPCETSNDGDGKIRYDAVAHRWVLVYFKYFSAPYGLCMAVSATSDATGAWHRYYWQFNSPPDSPMLGIWSDGYYVTINGILSADNLTIPVCAFDRSAMLTGAQATRQCFSTNAYGTTPVPGDMTGATPPPAGEPELVLNVGSDATGEFFNALNLHIDWNTPSQSALTSLGKITVAPYTPVSQFVPQPGTTEGLAEGNGGYPLAYRNFGDHESFVVSHEVAVDGVNSTRWYELRRGAGGGVSIYQQGTFAPGDGLHRWMSSVAMDKLGDIALGYSVASSSVYPGIRFTGRLVGDALGQMTQGEGNIVDGAGSQTNSERWGDYSSMSVDPTDGCTFWYTQEYMGDASGLLWRTRMASFRMPGCAGPAPTLTNGDFETGALSPWTTTGTASVAANAHGGSYAAQVGSTSPTNGDSSIAQSFTAPDAGATLSFWYAVHCPDQVRYDWATATLADTTAGTTQTALAKTCTDTGNWQQVTATLTGGHHYTLTLTSHDDGYAGDATYTQYDDVTVTEATPPPPPPPVQALANGDFETGALTPWTTTGTASVATSAHGGSYAAQVGGTSPTNGDSSIAQSFTAPDTDATLSFWYAVHCPDQVRYDWATATLADVTAGTTQTVLAKTCTDTGTWQQVTASVTGGHQYTLTLTSHDDGYAGDATYTDFDDVVVGDGTVPPPPPPPVQALTNGDFETGALTPWTTAGTASVATSAHGGSYAARAGGTGPTVGDSSLAQTFTASADGALSFWYAVHCPDLVRYDWATATLADVTAGTTRTVLAKTCTDTGTWRQVTASVAGGHQYTLTLTSHDDGYAGDATYTDFDDVTAP